MITVIKTPNESRLYTTDFSNRLGTGETVASGVVVSSPVGLTVGSGIVASPYVQFQISGGTHLTTYSINVKATTSSSNILEEQFEVAVRNIDWMTEMVIMLRLLINDMGDTQTYSDTRLAQLLCLGAKYVQEHQDGFAATYTIGVSELIMSPDPVVIGDDDFVGLTVLKAACFIDQGTVRTKAAAAGLRATLGSLSLDTSNNLDGFLKMLDKGPCAMFDDLIKDFAYGKPALFRAILSPFVNNKFDAARNLNYYMSSNRDRS